MPDWEPVDSLRTSGLLNEPGHSLYCNSAGSHEPWTAKMPFSPPLATPFGILAHRREFSNPTEHTTGCLSWNLVVKGVETEETSPMTFDSSRLPPENRASHCSWWRRGKGNFWIVTGCGNSAAVLWLGPAWTENGSSSKSGRPPTCSCTFIAMNASHACRISIKLIQECHMHGPQIIRREPNKSSLEHHWPHKLLTTFSIFVPEDAVLDLLLTRPPGGGWFVSWGRTLQSTVTKKSSLISSLACTNIQKYLQAAYYVINSVGVLCLFRQSEGKLEDKQSLRHEETPRNSPRNFKKQVKWILLTFTLTACLELRRIECQEQQVLTRVHQESTILNLLPGNYMHIGRKSTSLERKKRNPIFEVTSSVQELQLPACSVLGLLEIPKKSSMLLPNGSLKELGGTSASGTSDSCCSEGTSSILPISLGIWNFIFSLRFERVNNWSLPATSAADLADLIFLSACTWTQENCLYSSGSCLTKN